MATPETMIKSKVKRWLFAHAAWYSSISQRYVVGTPDFLCILKTDIAGRLTAIEVKSATGRLTKMQEHEASRMIAAGGRYYVAKGDRVGGWKLTEVTK